MSPEHHHLAIFCSVLRTVDLSSEADWRNIADALWLATKTGPTNASPTPRAGNEPQEETPTFPLVTRPGQHHSIPNADPPLATRNDTSRGSERNAERSWQLTTAGEAEGAGLAVNAPQWMALPGRAHIGKALSPLKRRHLSHRSRILDPHATVDAFCETGVLAPVLRPARERWFQVAVVADASPTMSVWHDTVAAFADLLERNGAFSAVTRWRLIERRGDVCLLTPSGVEYRPQQLRESRGRQIVLVVTDGTDELWRRASAWSAIRQWGTTNPVALVHMLPEGMWGRTATGEADTGVRSHRRGEANARLEVRTPWWWEDDRPPLGAVPVLALDEAALAPWARLVSGDPHITIRAIIGDVPDHLPLTTSASHPAGHLGDAIRASVSSTAFRLATLLSAVDVSLPVARVIMAQLLPQARQVHLAELLAAGVLRAAGDSPSAALDFAPRVRPLLQQLLTATEVLEAWRAVTPVLSAAGRRPQFSLLLRGQGDSLAEPSDPMSQIAQDLALRLGMMRQLKAPDASSVPIDLTIAISPGETAETFLWTFTTPHPVQLPEGPVVSRLTRNNAETFALRRIREMSRVDGSSSAEYQIAGIAAEVASAMPLWFWKVLAEVWRIAKDASRAPTLLIVSKDFPVPWELASTTEEFVVDRSLLDPTAPMLLGAQVAMGRWLPAGLETPAGVRRPSTSPPETIRITTFAVVVGEFGPSSGLRPLKTGMEEGRQLAARYPSVWVRATESEVSQLLSGQLMNRGAPVDAQVLHVISHGEINPESPWDSGVMLSDSSLRLNESMVSRSVFTKTAAPLVFLNCSQVATAGTGALVEGGLPAAFVQAGARALVAPLWSVDDDIAKDTALTFYGETLGRGRAVGDVMRELRARFTFPLRGKTTPLAYVYYGHPGLFLTLQQENARADPDGSSGSITSGPLPPSDGLPPAEPPS